eukprot:403371654
MKVSGTNHTANLSTNYQTIESMDDAPAQIQTTSNENKKATQRQRSIGQIIKQKFQKNITPRCNEQSRNTNMEQKNNSKPSSKLSFSGLFRGRSPIKSLSTHQDTYHDKQMKSAAIMAPRDKAFKSFLLKDDNPINLRKDACFQMSTGDSNIPQQSFTQTNEQSKLQTQNNNLNKSGLPPFKSFGSQAQRFLERVGQSNHAQYNGSKRKPGQTQLDDSFVSIISLSKNNQIQIQQQIIEQIFSAKSQNQDALRQGKLRDLDIINNPVHKLFLTSKTYTKFHRGLMTDWMIQVLRVFKVQNPHTYYTAQHIMDSYFIELLQDPQRTKQIDEEFIRLSGILAVFIASKYDDTVPITIRQVFVSAGHGKFQIDEIKAKELDILNTIKFKIHVQSIYQAASILIKQLNTQYKSQKISHEDELTLNEFLNFLCLMIQHSVEISFQNQYLMSITLAYIAWRYLKRSTKQKLLSIRDPNDMNLRDALRSNLQVIDDCYRFFKANYVSYQPHEYLIKLLMKKVVLFYHDFERQNTALKNLAKMYPQFMNQESKLLFSNKDKQS